MPAATWTSTSTPRWTPHGDRPFSASITIANYRQPADHPWKLHFLLPGGQDVSQIDGSIATWERVGGGVRMTGAYALPPGKALTVGMNGDGGNPAPPSNFTVNDVECDTRISQRPPGLRARHR